MKFQLNFEKYHGLGNDFIIFKEEELEIYIEKVSNEKTLDEKVTNGEESEGLDLKYGRLAQKVCDRNTGIGADGMIICRKLNAEKVEMLFFNQDGSKVPMCGNGIRCFSQFIYENKILEGEKYSIETGAGLLKVDIFSENFQEKEKFENKKFRARVNMGTPDFTLENIPIDRERLEEIAKTYNDENSKKNGIEFKAEKSNKNIEYTLNVYDEKYKISSVFMGTTHSVIFVENLEMIDVVSIGKSIELNPIYPKKTNVNFVEIKDRKNVEMKTWERGAGLTLACGTGACASVVIGNLKLNLLDSEVTVKLPKGELFIEVKKDLERDLERDLEISTPDSEYSDKNRVQVFMTGPSERIAKGVYFY